MGCHWPGRVLGCGTLGRTIALIPREAEVKRSQLPNDSNPQEGTGGRCGSGRGRAGWGVLAKQFCYGDRNEGQGGRVHLGSPKTGDSGALEEILMGQMMKSAGVVPQRGPWMPKL